MNKIKELLNSKLPNELSKELDQNIFTENNIEKVESNISDQNLLGKKKKKKIKIYLKKEKIRMRKKGKKKNVQKENMINFVEIILLKKLNLNFLNLFVNLLIK